LRIANCELCESEFHFAIRNSQFAIRNPQFAIRSYLTLDALRDKSPF